MKHSADGVNNPACTLCGAALTGIHRAGSWSEYGGGGGAWYDGSCPCCNIDYRLELHYESPGVWRMLAPEREALAERICPDELARLNKKLLRYNTIGPKWIAFLAKLRQADELWRFNRKDGETAIAIVRNGTPIAQFLALWSL